MVITEEQEQVIDAVEAAATECIGQITEALTSAERQLIELLGEERYRWGQKDPDPKWGEPKIFPR